MKFCPHCGGDLAPYLSVAQGQVPNQTASAGPYDQTRAWRELVALADSRMASPPAPEALVAGVTRPVFNGKPLHSVVHMIFDRNVVPKGGLLESAVQGIEPPAIEHLAAFGYAIEDKKVKLVGDAPVGQAYCILDYWGGGKQHKRWHLDEPIEIETSRHGNPLFMDDNMVAFGATWKDGERLDQAFHELLELFLSGVRSEGRVAVPVVLDVRWQ